MDQIQYRKNVDLDLDQFVELYRSSTLADRRPANDRNVMRQMMENASLTISAWDGDDLVGISRTLTDVAYVAYLADLAVAKLHQGRGIGRQLVVETKSALPATCMLVLLAAPKANDFYPKLGFASNPRAWVLAGDEPVL